MAATVAPLSQPPHKTWTRAELDALEATGLLADTRYELIEGELFDKMGQNPPHILAVNQMAALLSAIFGATRVRTQAPVELAETEAHRSLPEPDVAVTREINLAYGSRYPEAADVLLLAEISDSTYHYDTKRKARLYARAGFVEYIVLDLSDRELLVFQAPRDGVYTEMRVLRPGEVFRPLSAPEAEVAVADLLVG